MTRPPLANLLAIYDEDPHRLASFERALKSDGVFTEVWRPAAGWIAASAPLPGGEPDGTSVRVNGLAFAEGRDVVAPNARGDGRSVFAGIADLVDRTPDRLASLPGDFGFIRFRAGGEATVVRSSGGLVPFYVRHGHGRTIIATRLTDLVRTLSGDVEVDPMVLGVWTTGYGFFPDDRTFFRGVSIVPRGCFAPVQRGRELRTSRYWNPRADRLPYPGSAVTREHAERLRSLLIATLERDLDPTGGNLLTFSGGVDSSCLAVLATRVVGRTVDTWSLVAARPDQYARQMSYIEPLWGWCRIGRRWVVRLEPHTRTELVKRAPNAAFPILHPALCALPTVAREEAVRVLFGGEFADEVCGSAYTMPDWYAHMPLPRLLSDFRRLPNGRGDLRGWVMHRWRSLRRKRGLPFPLSLPQFVRLDASAEYHEWLDRRRRVAADDRTPRSYLAMRAEMDGFVAMNWEGTSLLGVRRSFPFFTRDVLELAFQCHPSELVGPGTKRLMRNALEEDVPLRILARRDKSDWSAPRTEESLEWTQRLPDRLSSVMASDWHPHPPRRVSVVESLFLTVLVRFAVGLSSEGLLPRSTLESRSVA